MQSTAHWSSTQASYTIDSGSIMQENQLAAQIAARHNIFPHHTCHESFWYDN